jgi:DNA-binding transcriptional regulator YdaS (Cro superfamily)
LEWRYGSGNALQAPQHCFIVGAVKLDDYLKLERGRLRDVANNAGLSAAFISQLALGARPVPADRAAEIERACAFNVMRWDLRPDDWHRIWPELIGAEGAPPLPVEPQCNAE